MNTVLKSLLAVMMFLGILIMGGVIIANLGMALFLYAALFGAS